jgi:hypothetical protein
MTTATPIVETCERCKQVKPCRFHGTPADVDKGTAQNGEWLCEPCVELRSAELDAACTSMEISLALANGKRFGDVWRFPLVDAKKVVLLAKEHAGCITVKSHKGAGKLLWNAARDRCVGGGGDGDYWIDDEVIEALRRCQS